MKGILKEKTRKLILKIACWTALAATPISLGVLGVTIAGKVVKDNAVNAFKDTSFYVQQAQEFEKANLNELLGGQITLKESESKRKEFNGKENTIKLINESEDEDAKSEIVKADKLSLGGLIGLSLPATQILFSLGCHVYVQKEDRKAEKFEEVTRQNAYEKEHERRRVLHEMYEDCPNEFAEEEVPSQYN